VSNIEQTPFTFTEFTENPEPRCACLLLLDTSGSMGGAPIRELNAGLLAFKEEISQVVGYEAGRDRRRHLRPGEGRIRFSNRRQLATTSSDGFG
jgi:hypothetical protein